MPDFSTFKWLDFLGQGHFNDLIKKKKFGRITEMTSVHFSKPKTSLQLSN